MKFWQAELLSASQEDCAPRYIKVDNSSCRVIFQYWHSRASVGQVGFISLHLLKEAKKRAQNGTPVSETHWNLTTCWDVTSCLAVSEEPVVSIFMCLETSVPTYLFNRKGITSAVPSHSPLPHRLICLVTDTKCTSCTAMCGVLCIADALYLLKVRKHDGGSVSVRGSTIMSDWCDRQTDTPHQVD